LKASDTTDYTFCFHLKMSARPFYQLVSYLYYQDADHLGKLELYRGDSEDLIAPP
jgi:hypothetical protein